MQQSDSSKTIQTKSVGLQITRGVQLRIPKGGLVFHATTGMEIRAVELQLDTSIHWLEISIDHVAKAKEAHEAQFELTDQVGRGDFLDCEFKSAMQASLAAATFFEALYAATKERIPIVRSPNYTFPTKDDLPGMRELPSSFANPLDYKEKVPRTCVLF